MRAPGSAIAHDNALQRALPALLKGVIMALFGLVVLAQVAYKLAVPGVPASEVIGVVGFMALATNGMCLAPLWRHRAGCGRLDSSVSRCR